MRSFLSRRQWLALAPLAGAAVAFRASGAQPASGAGAAVVPPAGPPGSFPSQDPALVREIVGASHRDIDRVRAMLKDAPRLANASYDWGFGDWETPLGAAAHTGRREIAELLLEHGARADLFASAMLGKLDAVRAAIESNPGIQRVRGPHGITLQHHARQGGEHAKAVVAYLETVGDADIKYPEQPLSGEERAQYLGAYAYGPAESQGFEIVYLERQERLAFKNAGGSRNLFHVGGHAFHPAGAHDVRLTFTVEGERATAVEITTPAPLVSAKRV